MIREVGNLLLGCHDLDLETLTVKIVENEFGPAGPNVVDSTCKTLLGALELGAWSNLALDTIGIDVRGDRPRYIELVRIWIR